ncbi:hypothetical protein JCM19296_1581 [Nonlabens ulvanivorans]|uniref:Uncharacterized protein n=1 Tax=Nonlabens ulvanivorans TaxID=906888 RepID=A0A081DAN8_NONUL|nr:hypothetical protein JCM19296_1581 [Nonlabens ulvanivorans]GAK89241.1 hypothetical protein JCM19297_1069 [Nonlabens ulvanivorans]
MISCAALKAVNGNLLFLLKWSSWVVENSLSRKRNNYHLYALLKQSI